MKYFAILNLQINYYIYKWYIGIDKNIWYKNVGVIWNIMSHERSILSGKNYA